MTAAYLTDMVTSLGFAGRTAEKPLATRRPRVMDDQQTAKTRDERALIKRCQAGDRAAFRELVERYQRRAYAIALGIVRNPEDAMDLTQEAFVKVHRYLDRFKGDSSFYTWLYRIVVNVSIDHVRKRKNKRAVDFDERRFSEAEVDGEELQPSLLGSNPERAYQRARIRKLVGLALDQLSDNHRAVIVMRELQGMSYNEMADAMECSKGTIMSRLFHARRNMQRALRALMDEQEFAEQAIG